MGRVTMDDIAAAAFDVIAGYVDDKRDSDDVWYDWSGELSARKWANKSMDEVVAGATEFIVFMVNDQGKQLSDRNIENWCVEWVDLLYADRALGDSRFCKNLSKRKLEDLEDAADDLVKLSREIEDYLDEVENQGRRSRGRDDRDRGRDRRDERSSRSRRSSSGSGTRRRRDQTEEDDREERSVRTRREEAPREEAAPAPVREPAKPKSSPGFDGPDYTKARPYDEMWIGEVRYELAKLSKLVPTCINQDVNGRLIPPFVHLNRVHNPNKELRYYAVHPDNTITEEYMKMSREADYARHEIVGKRRRHLTDADDSQKVVVDKKEYVSPENIPNESAPILRISRQPVQFSGESQVVQSEASAIALARLAAAETSAAIHRFDSIIVTPVVARDGQEMQKFMRIGQANNCAAASEMLSNTEISYDPSLFNVINDRLSKEVEHSLRARFGVGARFDDFANSYQELLNALTKRYSEAMVRSFAQATRMVPAVALQRITDASIKQQLTMDLLGLSETKYNAMADRVEFLADYRSYSLIDVTYGDIGLGLTEMPEVLDGNLFPQLFEIATGALNTSFEDDLGARCYLVTRDGIKIEVLESPSLRDTILLRIAQ